jgi:murein DD-endopeptidase MepM/ murein hydrolase activator NlpD
MSDAFLLPPCPGYPVSQPYGANKPKYQKLGLPMGHEGIDFACPVGTPIRAAAAGHVVTLQRDERAGHPYGVYLRLTHWHDEMAWITVYAHLDRIALGLRLYSPVERGEIIGWSGDSGRSTGPHLHLSVRRAGRIVDPAPFLLDGGAS